MSGRKSDWKRVAVSRSENKSGTTLAHNSPSAATCSVDFWKLPLSKTTRRRLAAIEESRYRQPRQKMMLADRLLSCAHDSVRGIYIPLVSHVWVPGKITVDFDNVPTSISASDGTELSFFCNALLLPIERLGIGEGGEGLARSVNPMLRITNPGFVVVTIEHDPECRAEFEDSINWTSKDGKLYELDKQLRTYKDYDGFCAVWSGNKSVHLHFVFDTSHLVHAQFEHSAAERWAAYAQQTAVMATVHRRYFDHLVKLSSDILRPSVQADMTLRSHSQFRRTPWGVRRLDKDSDITGLKAGMVAPQLVLAEDIRSRRSAKGSKEYLVPSDIVGERTHTSSSRSSGGDGQQTELGDGIIHELARMCRSEWGLEFPKPVRVRQTGGEWVFHFRNHREDQTPATVCRGDHCTHLVQGRGAPQDTFVLPGGLSANEWGDYLGLQFGLIKPLEFVSAEGKQARTNRIDRLKQQAGRPFKDLYQENLRNSFPERSSARTVELQATYRDRLRAACASVRSFDTHAIILSAEGIGKTRVLFEIMANEALDTALERDDTRIRFNAFAFRSELQAAEKGREYNCQTGRRTFLWRSFWSHYADACDRANRKQIPKSEFENETDVVAILGQIRLEQPPVFDRLEAVRRTLWVDGAGQSTFNSNTMLFTTHATVMSWVEGRVTRGWHHPDFDPSITPDEVQSLRDRTVLQDVVFDEPEFGELVWLLTAELHAHFASVKHWDWKRRTVAERRDLFDVIRRSGAIPSDMSFEAYSELRYLDLNTLDRVQVDFWAQPFGRESSSRSIYRSWHQTPFYLGVKRWPFAGSARITYLTTEAFTTEAITSVYEKASEQLFKLELDDLPPLYPIYMPVVKDKRARAQQIQELAKEILASSDTTVVIADRLGELKGERAMTFQGMKGHNGLSDKDVYIVVTFLAPEVYAELNVLGQWIGQPDTVAKYYAAQISQAIGRNTGFRQHQGTKTAVVISDGLLRLVRPFFKNLRTRFVLRPVPDRVW